MRISRDDDPGSRITSISERDINDLVIYLVHGVDANSLLCYFHALFSWKISRAVQCNIATV